MTESERQSAFLTALTTEHFVLQTAANTTTTEAGTRASLYIFSLSSSLVATGFVSRSPDIFVPFVVIVLSGVFMLGVSTVVRLVDSNLEGMHLLAQIAHIRSYYRTLTPEAADYFAAQRGRWPEAKEPALRLGLLIAFITTTASMVAFINSLVGGAVVAVVLGASLLDDLRTRGRSRRGHRRGPDAGVRRLPALALSHLRSRGAGRRARRVDVIRPPAAISASTRS